MFSARVTSCISSSNFRFDFVHMLPKLPGLLRSHGVQDINAKNKLQNGQLRKTILYPIILCQEIFHIYEYLLFLLMIRTVRLLVCIKLFLYKMKMYWFDYIPN